MLRDPSETEINRQNPFSHVALRKALQVEHPMLKHYPTRAELQRVCKEFQIGRYVSMHGRLGGMFNANVGIRTTKGYFVVRVMSGYATAQHLNYVTRVMYHLLKARVPVVFPLKHQSGRRYATLGPRYVQVTQLVQARSYQGHPSQIMASGRVLRFTMPRNPSLAVQNQCGRITPRVSS